MGLFDRFTFGDHAVMQDPRQEVCDNPFKETPEYKEAVETITSSDEKWPRTAQEGSA